MKTMCEKCTYVYNASHLTVGTVDFMCRRKPPGKLIAAPVDAVPGTYYDKSKDPMIRTVPR